MGPPIVTGGEASRVADHRAGPHASMGPPIVTGGEQLYASGTLFFLLASMGPPIVTGGELPQVMVWTLLTFALQWGRR